jgi:hypothetical protein
MSEKRTEEGIKNSIDALVGAVMRKDEEGAATASIILLGGVLLDLRNIANAVEKLSNFELTKIGEIVLGSSNPRAEFGRDEMVDMALTADEAETIEALRRGDIVVVNNDDNGTLAPDANEADYRERVSMQFYRDSGQAKYVQMEPGGPSRPVTWAELSEVERIEWRRKAGY